jgi:hypothetical protein
MAAVQICEPTGQAIDDIEPDRRSTTLNLLQQNPHDSAVPVSMHVNMHYAGSDGDNFRRTDHGPFVAT